MKPLRIFLALLFTVFFLMACTHQNNNQNGDKLEQLQAIVIEKAQVLSKAEKAYQQAAENLRLAQLTTTFIPNRESTSQPVIIPNQIQENTLLPQYIDSPELARIKSKEQSKVLLPPPVQPQLHQIKAICRDGSYSTDASANACFHNGGVATYHIHTVAP